MSKKAVQVITYPFQFLFSGLRPFMLSSHESKFLWQNYNPHIDVTRAGWDLSWYNGFCDNEMQESLQKALPKEFLTVAYMLLRFSRCYYDSFLLIIEKWVGILIMKYNCVERSKTCKGIIYEILPCVHISYTI